MVKISERRRVLESIAQDKELLTLIRGDRNSNELYQKILRSGNPRSIADETWKEFETMVLGTHIELHPIKSFHPRG